MGRRTCIQTLAIGCGAAIVVGGKALWPVVTWAQNASSRALLPAEVASVLPNAVPRGSVPFRYFGFLIYQLQLWAPRGFEIQRYEQQAFAFSLTYARDLQGSAIAESSLAEIKKIGFSSPEQQERWLAMMKIAFPDVKAGDRITGSHDGDGLVMFWHNGRATAKLEDADFARLFFGIWLAPRTSVPPLRDALLRAQND